MPKLDRRGKTFGFGADPAIMSCVAGRLLCDTYLCSRDLLNKGGKVFVEKSCLAGILFLLFISYYLLSLVLPG
jgi:hypothetical protein